MSESERGLVINGKTISILTGCAALFGVLIQGVSYAKSFEATDAELNFRMTQVEVWKDAREKSRDAFLSEFRLYVEKNNQQLTELKVSIGELKAVMSKGR